MEEFAGSEVRSNSSSKRSSTVSFSEATLEECVYGYIIAQFIKHKGQGESLTNLPSSFRLIESVAFEFVDSFFPSLSVFTEWSTMTFISSTIFLLYRSFIRPFIRRLQVVCQTSPRRRPLPPFAQPRSGHDLTTKFNTYCFHNSSPGFLPSSLFSSSAACRRTSILSGRTTRQSRAAGELHEI